MTSPGNWSATIRISPAASVDFMPRRPPKMTRSCEWSAATWCCHGYQLELTSSPPSTSSNSVSSSFHTRLLRARHRQQWGGRLPILSPAPSSLVEQSAHTRRGAHQQRAQVVCALWTLLDGRHDVRARAQLPPAIHILQQY